MDTKIKTYISDARKFQRYGEYDLAIYSLEKAHQLDFSHSAEVEIQKLLCFNYRKLGDYNLALFHISNAINAVKKGLSNNDQEEYAICLMNKGVVHEEMGDVKKALDCYIPASSTFLNLFGSEKEHYGVIINAFLTIGSLYYKQKMYSEAQKYLEDALKYFDKTEKDTDRRYLAIVNTLSEIDAKK